MVFSGVSRTVLAGDETKISIWQFCVKQRMTKSAANPTGLSDFTFTFHFQTLEEEMAAHSSVLA